MIDPVVELMVGSGAGIATHQHSQGVPGMVVVTAGGVSPDQLLDLPFHRCFQTQRGLLSGFVLLLEPMHQLQTR